MKTQMMRKIMVLMMMMMMLSEDDVGESNPLLVDPEKDTDEDTKVKLWFGKVRIIN